MKDRSVWSPIHFWGVPKHARSVKQVKLGMEHGQMETKMVSRVGSILLGLAVIATFVASSDAQARQRSQKPAAPSGPRLDYRQEKELKDAIGYLDEVEGTLNAIDEKTKGMQVGDASVPMQDVQNYVATKDKCVQRLGYAETRLTKLPADHPNVKPELERMAKLKEQLAATEKRLNELSGALGKVVEQGASAGYKADFARLKEIAQMFGEPQDLQTHPQRAIETIRQMPAAKKERERIEQTYANLLKQETAESRNMAGVLHHFDDNFGRYEQATNAYAAEAPAAIQDDIDQVLKMADDAVKNQRHLYFGEQGGVKQRLGIAQTHYDVFAAIAPDSAATVTAKQNLDAARAKVKEMKASLNDAIVAANNVPEETYSGADKAQLIELVKKKWSESGVASPVLKVGINSQQWQRNTRWEWNRSNAWEKVDKSFIQGHVIVKQDDKTAVIHYVNLVKDHLANDQITAHFFEDPKLEPDVSRKLAAAKVK